MAADPMYRQIAEDLRRKIEEGDPAPGAQLQTELELREAYNASRNTVRDAVKWLTALGLVETKPGQGTFVVQNIVPFLTTLTGDPQTGFGGGEDDIYGGKDDIHDMEVKAGARSPAASAPRVEIQQAAGTTAEELGLPAGSSMVSRHQQRFIDGTPWSLQTSFYPMNLVERGAIRLIQAPDIAEGTVAYLAGALGIKQAGWRDLITVRNPDETETAFFKLPDDGRVSVIETRRTAFDETGTPVRLTVTIYPADRNMFAVLVGRVPDVVVYPPGPDQ